MSPRILRRDRAADHLKTAIDAVESAIVTLGGRTRQRSVKKNQRLFTVRLYLEGIAARLHVCLDLLQVDAVVSGRFPVIVPTGFILTDELVWDDITSPRDSFETTYDRERSPQC